MTTNTQYDDKITIVTQIWPDDGIRYEQNPSSHHRGTHENGWTDGVMARPGAFLFSSESAIVDVGINNTCTYIIR